jgi:hypothetical protein
VYASEPPPILSMVGDHCDIKQIYFINAPETIFVFIVKQKSAKFN